MVPITKEEAKEIRKMCRNAYIIRTMKQHSKRGHYFLDESPSSMSALAQVRAAQCVGGDYCDA